MGGKEGGGQGRKSHRRNPPKRRRESHKVKKRLLAQSPPLPILYCDSALLGSASCAHEGSFKNDISELVVFTPATRWCHPLQRISAFALPSASPENYADVIFKWLQIVDSLILFEYRCIIVQSYDVQIIVKFVLQSTTLHVQML